MKQKIRDLVKIIGLDEYFYNGAPILRKALSDKTTILEVGCGVSSPYITWLKTQGQKATGIEMYAEAIEISKERGGYADYIQGDGLESLKSLPDNSYEAVIALDVVEHLTKERSAEMITQMERVASRTVGILTPNGWHKEHEVDAPGMEHLCGWTAAEFKAMGYDVTGVGGADFLRNEHSWLRGFRTRKLLRLQVMVFYLTQPFVRYRPELAYGALAIKNKAA